MVQDLWIQIKRHGLELKPGASEVMVGRGTVALKETDIEQPVTFYYKGESHEVIKQKEREKRRFFGVLC